MIQSFEDEGTRDVFHGVASKLARRTCPLQLWGIAMRKLDQLNQALRLLDLHAPPGNRLEALKGRRRGQYSIRINDRYRVCFRWTDLGPKRVQIVDYHR